MIIEYNKLFLYSPKNSIAFCTAIEEFFWLIKDNNVFAIPIPAISIALINTKDKNCEKLSIILLKPQAAFFRFLILALSSFANNSSTFLNPSKTETSSLNFTLYS